MCSAHFQAENRAFQQLDTFSFEVDASLHGPTRNNSDRFKEDPGADTNVNGHDSTNGSARFCLHEYLCFHQGAQ